MSEKKIIRGQGIPRKRILSARLMEDLIKPIANGASSPFGAAVATSMPIGFSILKNMLALPPVTEADPDAAEACVTEALARGLELGRQL